MTHHGKHEHEQQHQPHHERRAVQFGAGNIGRGFIAEHLTASGYEVIFVDVVDALINSLQTTPSYEVTEIGTEGEKKFTIRNYRAINSKTHEADVIKEISTAHLVTCAVGPNILKFIAPVIAKGIDARPAGLAPLAVIACENAIGATDTLAAFIKEERNTPPARLASIDERARFANAAIDRIVPNQEAGAGLDVKIESFYEWVVDRSPFAAGGHHPPNIHGVKWVEHLQPYIERKLFTVNTGHATAAYHGHARGKREIADALADADVHAAVQAALRETSRLVVLKHGINRDEQADYARKIVQRISNPHLHDGVERVGRAPLRKLSRKERFVGPAAELLERGEPADALLGAIEMAFRFQNVPGDDESAELAKILQEHSAKDVVAKVTGLDAEHPLFAKVQAIVEKVQAK